MQLDVCAVLVVACLTAWFLILKRNYNRPRNLPPGPYPLPIIGNIHQLGKQSHKTLSKLSKTYGPLMSLKLGSKYALVISCPEIAKEILQKHDLAFSGRVIPDAAEAYHENSMLFSPTGNQWRKLRKLSKEQMFTNYRLVATQELRQEKVEKLCEYVGKCCQESGQVVNLREASLVTTLNLMSATLFSTQVSDYGSNASTNEFKDIFEGLGNVLGQPNIVDFFPIFKPIDPQGVRKKSHFYYGKLFAFIQDIINQRLQSPHNSDKKTDFLETLIDISQTSEYRLSMDAIKVILGDFFGAGSDTTSTTVEWAMKEVLAHPDKLSKIKHELRSVIGDDVKKQVQESDISKLPYLQAVVKESLRLHPPGPFLIPRVAEKDVQLRGYTIPKGAHLLVNIWAIGRDPSIWSNPDAFEPGRFLDHKIDFKGLDMELIPFGFGRRMCPGLPLASRMVHMMLANLIHKFDWKLQADQGVEQDFVGELFGLALRSSLPLKAIPSPSK